MRDFLEMLEDSAETKLAEMTKGLDFTQCCLKVDVKTKSITKQESALYKPYWYLFRLCNR